MPPTSSCTEKKMWITAVISPYLARNILLVALRRACSCYEGKLITPTFII